MIFKYFKKLNIITQYNGHNKYYKFKYLFIFLKIKVTQRFIEQP